MTKQFNKIARERTKRILEIIAEKMDQKLEAEIICEIGLREETLKRYILEAAHIVGSDK